VNACDRETLRLASIDDVPELVSLLAELFTQEADFSPQPERQRRALVQILTTSNYGRIWVAECDGHCIGMVSLLETVSTAEGGPAVWLEDFIVSKTFRGMGIGGRLLEAALGDCRERGITRVTLLTDRDNASAKRMYARHGFTESAMLPLRRYL